VDVIPLAAFSLAGAVFGAVYTVVVPKSAAGTLTTTNAAILQMNAAERDEFGSEVSALVWPLTLLALLAAAITLGALVVAVPILAGIDPDQPFDVVRALFVVVTCGWIALTWWSATRARRARQVRSLVAELVTQRGEPGHGAEAPEHR
jgi:hypothetical protein